MDGAASSTLLSQADPSAFRVVNEGAGADFLIVCDHAGRLVPARLALLGVPSEAFERHIAWDIGAAGVAVELATRLGATAVLQTYSRLVVDCNRDPASAAAIPVLSDGVVVPANQDLTPDERQARLDEVFTPYHAAVAAELDRFGTGRAPAVVSIHSFTPELQGAARPWLYGVIHDGTSRLSKAMITLLREAVDDPIGDNEPYAMDGTDFTVPYHAGRRGLAYLELEIRQDLIAHPDGQARVAELLSRLLPEAARRTR